MPAAVTWPPAVTGRCRWPWVSAEGQASAAEGAQQAIERGGTAGGAGRLCHLGSRPRSRAAWPRARRSV